MTRLFHAGQDGNTQIEQSPLEASLQSKLSRPCVLLESRFSNAMRRFLSPAGESMSMSLSLRFEALGPLAVGHIIELIMTT
jgi:hypothetical protein